MDVVRVTLGVPVGPRYRVVTRVINSRSPLAPPTCTLPGSRPRPPVDNARESRGAPASREGSPDRCASPVTPVATTTTRTAGPARRLRSPPPLSVARREGCDGKTGRDGAGSGQATEGVSFPLKEQRAVSLLRGRSLPRGSSVADSDGSPGYTRFDGGDGARLWKGRSPGQAEAPRDGGGGGHEREKGSDTKSWVSGIGVNHERGTVKGPGVGAGKGGRCGSQRGRDRRKDRRSRRKRSW